MLASWSFLFLTVTASLSMMTSYLTLSAYRPIETYDELKMDNIPAIGFIEISSQRGDFVGQGENYFFTNDNGKISVSGQFTENGDLNHLSIIFRGDDRWDFVFAAPEGEPLRVGEYTDALRAAFANPVKPGMDVSGAGRGCNRLSGDFVINEIGLAQSNTLDRFVAEFNQKCENSSAILTGSIDIMVQS